MAIDNETSGDNGAELSLRETLEQAFTDAEGTDDPPPAAPAPEPGAPAPEPAPDPGGRARDASGRFMPREGAQEAAGAAQTPPAGAVPPAPEPKAPASWRPDVREKWAGVDPLVRGEVLRREHEMQTVLQEAASARQFVAAFENVVRPYEMFMRAENASPLQSVQNLMQTAADLRVGTPQHKANLVAGIINNFGIDVHMLDSILAGQPAMPGAAGAQQQPFRDPRFDQFLAMQAQYAQQQEQAEALEMRQGLDAFAADPRHEFYRDVAGIMADIVEVKARQGQQIDLEKIYAQACQMHDNVSTVLTARAGAQQATGNRQAVLRAKRAASSLKGDSTVSGSPVPRDDSVRASIEAAIESLGNT